MPNSIRVEGGTSNALLYRYNQVGQRAPFPVKVASGVTIKVGQLIGGDPSDPTSTHTLELMSSSNDTISSLIGVAIEAHGSTEGAKSILVDVSPDSVYETQAGADARGWAFGQAMAFASAGGLAKSAATVSRDDLFVVVATNTSTAATTILVKSRPGRSFLDLSDDA